MLERSSNVKNLPRDLYESNTYERRKIPLPHTAEGGFVTICVAAIARGCIYGASDRMITAWTTEFETGEAKDKNVALPHLKSIPLTTSIVAMIAGDDVSLLSQLIYDLQFLIAEKLKADSSKWLSVSDIAHEYRRLYLFRKREMVERTVLLPHGLDYDKYTNNQARFASAFLLDLKRKIEAFSLPSLSVIFAGVDSSGAHLYVARNDDISCEDLLGFAAIGSGYWHAESYFMAAGHTKHSDLDQSFYATYAAKRRAELAPGVGSGVDMFGIGPQPGTYFPIAPVILDELKAIYIRGQRRAKKALEREKSDIAELTKKLTKQAQELAQKHEGKKPEEGQGGPTS